MLMTIGSIILGLFWLFLNEVEKAPVLDWHD